MPGVWLLTGSERMKSRPIYPLVKVLLEMGADIVFQEQEARLPLLIRGGLWKWKSCCIDIALSSQFATAMLLVLPLAKEPVSIKLCNGGYSQQYILQTVELMKQLGICLQYNGDSILYQPVRSRHAHDMKVEQDWSAAAFWYEYMVLRNSGEDMFLEGLSMSALQKDSIVADWMQAFGIQTVYTDEGVILHRMHYCHPQEAEYDVADNLDLVPAMLVTCAALRITACFKGADNLQYKESNRIEALRQALQSVARMEYQNGELKLYPTDGEWPQNVNFDVHHDHRVAMALAMLPCVSSPSAINDEECVSKSYPHFWSQWHNICMQK